MKRQRLLGIQFARGIAALLVVIYHGSRMVQLPQYAGREGFGGLFAFGHAGVDFFFVLSGFIIYFVHHSDLGCPQELLRYAWRRVTRIYPSYWVVLAVSVAMLAVKHDSALTPAHFVKSLFLFPDTQDPLLAVAWTLVHEMLFYIVFALAILDLRLGIAAALAWVAVILSGIGVASDQPVLHVIGALRNLQFVIGIAAAYAVLHMRLRLALWLALFGIAGFLATGFAENAGLIGWDSKTGSMAFGLFAGVAITGIAAAERNGALHMGRIGEFFGGMSYLLYLVHTIVIGWCLRGLAMGGLFHTVPGWVAVLLGAIFSIIAASLLYAFYDKPVQAVLNRFGQQRLFAKRQPA